MTELKEGGAPTVADASRTKSGVGSSSQDPVKPNTESTLQSTDSKFIGIRKVVTDYDFFLRDGLNGDAVERYKELYQSGVVLPPLVLQHDTNLLLDGFHRYKALQELGKDFVPVVFLKTEQPFVESYRLNSVHGVPLSKRERDKAIKQMYERDNMTQAEIAEIVGLSQRRISQILGIEETSNTNNEEDKRRTLNDAELHDIVSLCLGKTKQKEIAEKFGVTQSRVSQVFREFKDLIHTRYTRGLPLDMLIEISEVDIDHDKTVNILQEYDNIDKDHLQVPRIIHGDLFDNIDKVPDESIDLIYVDPPFNITGEDWDQFDTDEVFIEFTRRWLTVVLPKLKKSGRLYVSFSQQYLFEFYELMQEFTISSDLEFAHLIVWQHANNVEQLGRKNYKRTWDPVFYYRRPDAGEIHMDHGRSWEGSPGDFDVWKFAQPQTNFVQDQKQHPTQKPLGLLKHIVETGSESGDLVLDPFAGSGTTAIACIQTERNYCVIEQGSDFIELIKERIQDDIR